MSTTSAGTLTLVNAFSGEVVPAVTAQALLDAAGLDDLQAAQMVELAAFADNTRELASIAAEARNVVSDEMVRRLDRAGRWTWREEGFEVKAPSPEAGTTKYHTGLLREALTKLIGDGVISAEGAASAVAEREHTVAVPYALLREVLAELTPPAWRDGDPDEAVIAEIRAYIADEPPTTYYQRPSGIRNLLRIPAARDAIEACKLPATPPPRSARVRRVNS